MHQMITDQPKLIGQSKVFAGNDPVVCRRTDQDQKRLIDQPAGIINSNDLSALLAGDLALKLNLLFKKANQALLKKNTRENAGGIEMSEIIILMSLIQERQNTVGAGCGAFANVQRLVIKLTAAVVGLCEEICSISGSEGMFNGHTFT